MNNLDNLNSTTKDKYRIRLNDLSFGNDIFEKMNKNILYLNELK